MRTKTQMLLLGILLVPCWVIASKYDIDLVNIYAAAKMTATDITRIFVQHGENGQIGRYFYGPISLVFFAPFAHVSYETVKWFWICLQTVSYVVFWIYLYKLYPVLREPKFFWSWVAIFIMAINPIHNNYQSNNIQLMLMAVAVFAEWGSYQKSKWINWISAAMLSIAAMIKVFPAFLVVYSFITKKKDFRIGLVAGVVISLVVPLIYFGIEPGTYLFKEFLFSLTTYNDDNNPIRGGDILCLPTLLARWMYVLQPGGGLMTSIVIKGTVLLIASTFFLYVLMRRNAFSNNSRYSVHLWALASALMVLINPSTRPHYFIFYVPAFCSLFEIAYLRLEKKWLAIVTASTLIPIAFTTDAILGKNLNDVVERMSVPTFGFLALCILIAWAVGRFEKVGSI